VLASVAARDALEARRRELRAAWDSAQAHADALEKTLLSSSPQRRLGHVVLEPRNVQRDELAASGGAAARAHQERVGARGLGHAGGAAREVRQV
jgi:hypothetical protein